MGARHLIGTCPHPKYHDVRVDLYYVVGTPPSNLEAEVVVKLSDGTPASRSLGFIDGMTITNSLTVACAIYDSLRSVPETK